MCEKKFLLLPSALRVFTFRWKTRFFRALNLRDASFVDDDLHGAEAHGGDFLADDFEPGLYGRWGKGLAHGTSNGG